MENLSALGTTNMFFQLSRVHLIKFESLPLLLASIDSDPKVYQNVLRENLHQTGGGEPKGTHQSLY